MILKKKLKQQIKPQNISDIADLFNVDYKVKYENGIKVESCYIISSNNSITIRLANHKTKLRTWTDNYEKGKEPNKCISLVIYGEMNIMETQDGDALRLATLTTNYIWLCQPFIKLGDKSFTNTGAFLLYRVMKWQ
ncbi:MAG: hypothetical protein E7140_05115 [Rikenellaceae bacterium]|nr:hypothetical protein [Rikenellaceae bacterium]